MSNEMSTEPLYTRNRDVAQEGTQNGILFQTTGELF